MPLIVFVQEHVVRKHLHDTLNERFIPGVLINPVARIVLLYPFISQWLDL